MAVGTIAGAATLACSSDDSSSSSNNNGGSGGTAGGAGEAPSGGMTANGGGGASNGGATGGGSGGTSAGGTGGSGGAVDYFTCIANQAANDPDPSGTATAGDDCCGGIGTCTASADLSGDTFADNYGLSGCDESAGLVCAPKPDDQLPLNGVAPACTLTIGSLSYEGRCLPKCFVIATPGASNLNPGDCPTDVIDDVVCAPCYSPLDGQESGACSRNQGDAPVQPAPEPFAECGRFGNSDAGPVPATGYCVAEDVVAASGQSADALALLFPDTCETGELCVPKNKVEDISKCFETCEQTLSTTGAVCVPTYLVEAPGSPGVGLSSVLGQVTCQDGETCTPCTDPLSPDNAATGACDN